MTDKLIEAVARGIWNRPVGYKRVSFDQLDDVDQDVFRAYARAAIAAIEASGTHRVVPMVPTELMVDGFIGDLIGTQTFMERYTAMINAAPKVTE